MVLVKEVENKNVRKISTARGVIRPNEGEHAVVSSIKVSLVTLNVGQQISYTAADCRATTLC